MDVLNPAVYLMLNMTVERNPILCFALMDRNVEAEQRSFRHGWSALRHLVERNLIEKAIVTFELLKLAVVVELNLHARIVVLECFMSFGTEVSESVIGPAFRRLALDGIFDSSDNVTKYRKMLAIFEDHVAVSKGLPPPEPPLDTWCSVRTYDCAKDHA